jgi:hypothetical protein
MDGIQGARICCGHGMFAHNFVKIGGLLEGTTTRQHEHPNTRTSNHDHLKSEAGRPHRQASFWSKQFAVISAWTSHCLL